MVTRAALAGLALALVAGRAHADDEVARRLDAIGAAKARLRYHDALADAEAALALGRADPTQLVALHRLAGELAAGLDQPEVAAAHFARWLALAPDAALPGDASPKLTGPFAAARRQLAGAALIVRARVGADQLALVVEADPLALVRGVRVRVAGEPPREALAALALALAPGAAPVEVAALDAAGNELRVLGPFARAPASTPTRPLIARWQPWAGATVALAACGGLFAWRLDAAQGEFDRLAADSEAHTLAELDAVARRGERHALLANLALGAAAGTALVTAVLALRGEPTRASRVQLIASPTGLGLGARF